MANSINDAGASAGSVVSTIGAARRNVSWRRHALLGSSALVGIAMTVSPAMAQTSVNPAGGGTVSFPNGTVTGGGAGQGVQVSGSTSGAVTVTNVNITQTTNTPTNNALDVSGPDARFIGTNSLSTTNSGGAAFNFITNVNKAIDLTGSDNSFTGSYGLKVAAPNGFVVVNSTGHTQTVTGNGTAVAGFYVTSLVNPELYFGTSVVSGFATGAYMSQAFIGGGVTFVSTGGLISASSIGINADNGVGSAFINSQTAITAPTGISATVSTGATITTSGGGTINSTAAGSGTGIFATNSGSGNVVVAVGAAIGGTTAPLNGVDARNAGTGSVSVTNTAAINATQLGITATSAGTTGNSITANANVTGGGVAAIQAVGQNFTITVGNGATVSNSAGNSRTIIVQSGDATIVNNGTIQNTGASSNSAIQFGQAGTVTNTGTISYAGSQLGAIYANTGLTVTNSGTISSTGAQPIAIFSAGSGTHATSVTNQSGGVINGTIGLLNTGTGANTLDLQAGSTTGGVNAQAGGTTTTTLAGTLTGAYSGQFGAGATNFTLASSGSMQAATFGSANDTFTFNGGTIGGVVNAGGGTDTFNSVLGAGNSATVSLSNLTGFENYNHLSGTLTLSGSRASGPGWSVTSGASVTLSGALNVTSGTGTAFSINGNTSGSVFQTLASGSITGFAGLFFNGGPSATLNNAGSISTSSRAVQTNGSTAITNTGTIASSGEIAIFTGFSVASLVNSGTVSGGASSFGISSQFSAMTITNQAGGFITGGTAGILGGTSGFGGLLTISNASGAGIAGPTAISITNLAGLALTNSGQIIGSTNAINAGGSGAVTITNNVGGVIATGTLASAGANFVPGGATDAVILSTTGATTINNSGMIAGGLAGIAQAPGATGALTVINRAGTINGATNDGITARGVFNAVNAQGATISSQVNSGIAVVGTSSVTNGGTLTGGNDATFGYGLQSASTSATTFNNFGSATGSRGGVLGLSSGVMAINLFAGSNTGNIVGGSGNDTLSLYNGTGTGNTGTSYVVATNTLAAGVPTDATRVLVQNAGTLAGATVGAINLGGGTNTLALRGTGDGTAANGAIGVLSASSIAGLSVLNKLDSGTWNITSGSFNYTGGTNVQAGRLVFVNRTVPAGTTTISSGATLEFNLTGGNYFQDSATINGAGSLVKSGPALLANRGLISLAAGGLIDVQGGTLVGSSDGIGRFTGNLGSLNVATGATFVTSEATVVVDRLTGTGTVGTASVGNFTVGINNGSGTFGGSIVDQNGTPGGKLVKAGTGNQAVTGANTYTGATTISGGTLAIGGTGTLGASAITNNATFDIAGHTGGLSVLNLLGSGVTTLGANTLTITAANGTYSGAFTGTGGFTKQGAGTYVLSGANSYTGITTISAGTLQGTTNSIVGSSIVDNATLAYNQAFSGTVTQNISGSGRVTVTGLGANTLTFAGNLTNNGVDVTGTSIVSFGGTSSTSGQTVNVTAIGTTINVLDNASLSSGGTPTIFSGATGTIVNNLGAIASATDIAVNLSQGGTFNNGSVIDSVADVTGGFIGLASGSPLATVNNYGAIRGTSLDGINSPMLNLTNFATGIVTGGRFGVGGNLLTIGNAGLIVGSTSGVSASSTVAITNSGLIGAGTLSGTTQASYTAGGNAGIVASNGGTITNLNGGTISGGTASIQLTGAGYTVNLNAGSTTTGLINAGGTSGSNSYTVLGTLNGGLTAGSGNDTVTFDTTNGSISGNLEGGAGTDAIIVNGAVNRALAGNITGFENLAKNGTGTLTLSGSNSGFSTVAINSGTLNGTSSSALGGAAVAVASDATFGVVTDQSIGSLSGAGNVALTGTLTTGTNGQDTSFSGVASGAGGLTKVGGGTLTLSGANTFTGDVLVSAGTLAYGADNVLNDGVTVTVASGATFNLNTFSDTIGTLNLHGTLANGGLLTAGTYNAFAGSTIGQAISSGTLNVFGNTTLTAATAATPININAGTLTTGSAELLSDTGTVAIASGSQLMLGGAETIASIADLNGGGGTIDLAGKQLTIGGDNSDSVFSGSIQSNFTPALTYVGSYSVGDGPSFIVEPPVYSGQSAAALLFGGLPGDYAISTTGSDPMMINHLAYLDGYGDTTYLNSPAPEGYSLGDANGNYTFPSFSAYVQDHSGPGDYVNYVFLNEVDANGLTKTGTGTLTLTGHSSYSGGTTVLAGTLAVSTDTNSFAADALGTGFVAISAGATVRYDNPYDSVTTGPSGSQIYASQNTYTGTGTLAFTGDSASLTVLDHLNGTANVALDQDGLIDVRSGHVLARGSGVFAGNQANLNIASGAVFETDADISVNSLTGSGSYVGNGQVLTVGVANGGDIFAGAISDNVSSTSLTKTGTGTLTLSGANTGLGAIVINGGTLSVGSAANLGATGAISLLGGTLATTGDITTNRTLITSSASSFGGIDVAPATTFTVAGSLSGDGALTKTGLGTLNLLAANSGFTGDLFVNGGAVRAGDIQAFGTGTIHLVDPMLIYGATGTYANNILLEVQSPASADPSTLRAETGVFAAISGSITQGTGIGVDPLQPLVIDGPGVIVLTNTANNWAGTTTITAGSTLQGTVASISGGELLVNGTLQYIQPTSGTLTQNASGTGGIFISGLGAGETFTVASTLNMTNNGLIVSDASALAVSGSILSATNTALRLNNTGAIGTSVLTNGGTISGVAGVFAGGQAAVTNMSGASIASTIGNIVRLVGTDSSLINAGAISGASNFAGVFFDGIGSVTNQTGGSITNTATAVQFGGANGMLDNSGTISNTNTNSAVFFNGTGSVTNQASGMISSPNGFGVQLTGAAATVNNLGVINAGQRGVSLDGANATLTNSGQISGSNAAVVATNGVVTNSGTLTGTVGSALVLTGGGSVMNTATGQITATGNAAVLSQGAALMLTNQGSLNGTTGIAILATGAFNNIIDLQAGSTTTGSVTTDTGVDTLTVAGMVTGAIGLGAGNDSFTLATGSGGVSGAIDGGTGTDSFVSTGTGSTTLAGTITGFESLAQNGTGTLAIIGTNTGFTTVAVNAGTLNVSGGAAIDDTAAVTVASGATLGILTNETVGTLALAGTLGGAGTLTAASYTLTGATVNGNLGAGPLTQAGGTSMLNGTAAATTVMVNSGTLALGGNERLADIALVQIATGAVFDLAGRAETIGTLGGTGTVALGAGRLVVGGTDAVFGYGGNITGSGDVDKNGTGSFTLASNVTQTGRLNLNAGTTVFTGSTAGSVRVQGGTLTGSAAIAGNLAISTGAFSPGTTAQPIGQFTAGSLNVSGGTLTFDLGGPATSFAADMIRVSGAAVLTGGTVVTRAIEPTATYNVAQTYVLLQSAALSGTFANGATFTATGTNPDLQYRLRYDLVPNSVVLELRKQIDFTTGLGPNASANELAVGSALNGGAFTASDNWASILNTINSQDAATRRATYNSISGEAISDISSSTMLAATSFNDLLRQRLATGGGATGNADLLSGLVGGKRALVALVAAAPLDGAGAPSSYADAANANASGGKRAGVWLQGYGANGRIDGLPGQAGIDTFSAGVAGGIDARVGDFTIGGAFAASQVETKIRSRTSTNEGTLYQGGGYVAYDNGRIYGSVMGSYFSGDIDSRRTVVVGGSVFGVASGTAKTRGYTAGAALGYRLPLTQSVLFTPQASFTATGVTRDAFTETGAGGLSLQASREHRQLYAATGEGRLSRVFNALGGVVEPYVGGGAIYSFGDLDTGSTNRFSGAPVGTGTFSIQGARLAPLTALVNGGINVRPSQNVQLGLQGEARLSNRQREERVSLNLRIGF